MGGDDLGDDDNYFLAPVVADDDDDETASKRPLAALEEEQTASTAVGDGTDERVTKKPKKVSNENVLIESGCGIESRSVEEQLSFLKASLKHYALLAAGEDGDGHTDEENTSAVSSLTTKSLVSSTKSGSLVEQLRDLVSLKRLKKHRDVRSPGVVIVCQSARRAVAVLKDLTPLRLRATKLFPKNGEVPQQLTTLRQNPFPLAVGTPHRLAALCAEIKGLEFSRTQIVVLDSYISKKQYTVCTLPDTAADTMALLENHVLPQMKTNKNLKLAFL